MLLSPAFFAAPLTSATRALFGSLGSTFGTSSDNAMAALYFHGMDPAEFRVSVVSEVLAAIKPLLDGAGEPRLVDRQRMADFMASLTKENDRGRVGWRLQFRCDGKRHSLWLGSMSKRAADTIALHVAELARAADANVQPEPAAVKWTVGVEARIHKLLSKWGLVETRNPSQAADQKLCDVFFETYIKSRTDLKPTTQTKYRQSAGWFVKHIGPGRLLVSVTPAEFDQWRRWMIEEGLAQATANKHAKRIKKLLTEAQRARLLPENPAAESRIGGEVNRSRDHYITRTDAAKIIAKCDTEWALIFGLCRYAGFRCPTEVVGLKWSDVIWDEGKLRHPTLSRE